MSNTKKYVSEENFKINPTSDVLAYIDEAGDEGWSPNSTRWFVVGSAIATPHDFTNIRKNIDRFLLESGRKWKNVHFRKLNHKRKKDLAAYIAKEKYTTVFSAFSKFELSKEEKEMCSYPSMYFIGIKNLVERISWYTKQAGFRKAHIMIGNRNKVKAYDLRKYLYESSVHASRNLTYFDKIGNIIIGNESKYGIKFADTITSSMFNLLEPAGVARLGDRSYYDICIRKRIYKSEHSRYPGIWNNGFRCTPRKKELVIDIDDGILTEE